MTSCASFEVRIVPFRFPALLVIFYHRRMRKTALQPEDYTRSRREGLQYRLLSRWHGRRRQHGKLPRWHGC
jgi:hypothetical protein